MAKRRAIPIPSLTQDVERRLMGRITRVANGCWLWQGARGKHGYGRMAVDGETYRTHRLAYAIFCGPIPLGIEVCHNCPGGDNPACLNPAHLFLGTHSDNMKDAVNKGTVHPPPQIGEANHNTSLTADDVRIIRFTAKLSKERKVVGWRKELAKRFRISERGIHRIVSGEVWGHVQ